MSRASAVHDGFYCDPFIRIYHEAVTGVALVQNFVKNWVSNKSPDHETVKTFGQQYCLAKGCLAHLWQGPRYSAKSNLPHRSPNKLCLRVFIIWASNQQSTDRQLQEANQKRRRISVNFRWFCVGFGPFWFPENLAQSADKRQKIERKPWEKQ